MQLLVSYSCCGSAAAAAGRACGVDLAAVHGKELLLLQVRYLPRLSGSSGNQPWSSDSVWCPCNREKLLRVSLRPRPQRLLLQAQQ